MGKKAAAVVLRVCAASGSEDASDSFRVDERSPEEELGHRRLWGALEEAIARLDPVERSVVEGVLEGKTIEEAALPLSKSWGSRRFARAVATLKTTMVRAGYADEFEPGALTARSTLRGPPPATATATTGLNAG